MTTNEHNIQLILAEQKIMREEIDKMKEQLSRAMLRTVPIGGGRSPYDASWVPKGR